MPVDLETLVGQVVDGKYRVERLLGQGGMGAVFRAVHEGTSRTVALKIIAPQCASRPEFLQRFQREARACGGLRHPNIVDVTDFGVASHESGRLAYLVMEYLDGCSLAEILRHEARLPLAWSIDVLEQVCSAVEEAHRSGILHRDLKPDNIWLEPNRRGGYTVKVLDFGLAKLAATTGGAPTASQEPLADVAHQRDHVRVAGIAAPVDADTEGETLARPSSEAASVTGAAGSGTPTPDDESATLVRASSGGPAAAVALGQPADDATHAGSIVGTPAYMSPEQIRGLALTPRSDVYSLGVIAYLMITGRPPFGGTTVDVLKSHLAQPPRPIHELRADLPPDAAGLIMSALSKDPEARPPGALAFAEMLAARFETPGAFLHKALQAFLARFGVWLRLSILCFVPLLLFSSAFALAVMLQAGGLVDWPWLFQRGVGRLLLLAFLTLAILGMSALGGVIVPAAMQDVAAPLRPIEIGFLLRTFAGRLRQWARAMLPVFGALLGFVLVMALSTSVLRQFDPWLLPYLRTLSRPWRVVAALASFLPILAVPLGIIYVVMRRFGGYKAFQFLGAVMLVEGLKGRRALERAAELHDKAGNALQPFQVVVVVASAVFGGAIGAAAGLSQRYMGRGIGLGWIAPLMAILFVVAASFLSLVGALTYLRARRAAGEPLDRAFEDFERSVLPPSHWQLAQRDRVRRQIELTR